MGDVIKVLPIRSYKGERKKMLRLYFDSGSPYTFIKENKAKMFKDIIKLTVPGIFTGLGNGTFSATHIMHLEVNLLGFWCRHYCYVVNDKILDEDLLVGHDFMQKFDIMINLKKKDIILNEASLKRAQKVRSSILR